MLPGVDSCVCESDANLHVCFPDSSGAFEFTHVLAAALDNPHALWTAKVAFCVFVLLAACNAFVATVGGLEGPSGGNSFQHLDAMLAALLFSGIELVGHITLFSGIELVGHFVVAIWSLPLEASSGAILQRDTKR